jgi:uncharacterized protein
MPRPFKRRILSTKPRSRYFKPAGVPMRSLDEVVLTAAEVEALKMRGQGLSQTEIGGKMGVSQPTLHRILSSAVRKVGDALANGKAIRID